MAHDQDNDSDLSPDQFIGPPHLPGGHDEVGADGSIFLDDEDRSDESPSGPLSEDMELTFHEKVDLAGQIEAIVFASPKPIKSREILEFLESEQEELSLEEVESTLADLVRSYKERGGGFTLVQIPRYGFQFQTVKAVGRLMEKMFSSRPRPLSRAALESLAVIAYKQPVTRADIEHIRGVDSGSIIKNLLERELVACVGRKEESGRPMLFGTTHEFLKVFNLSTLDDLPPLSSFQPSPDLVKGVKERMGEGDHEPNVSDMLAGDHQADMKGRDDHVVSSEVSDPSDSAEEEALLELSREEVSLVTPSEGDTSPSGAVEGDFFGAHDSVEGEPAEGPGLSDALELQGAVLDKEELFTPQEIPTEVQIEPESGSKREASEDHS